MGTSIGAAMRILEAGDLSAAERAFAEVTGSARDRVIARFRRAECLSRLGRHDEAVADAARAHADGGDESAPYVGLVHCLAEAGRAAEIPAVAPPPSHHEELGPLRDGYAAAARVAAGDRSRADADVAAVLDTRHAPLYSLALRAAEAARLASAPRWPDLPSVWYAHECRLEMKAMRQTAHPATPSAANAGKAVRWLRLHWSCADHGALIAAIRAGGRVPDGLDECALEQNLAFGRIDEASALASELAKAAGEKASGELCIDLARIAQIRGEPSVPSSFPGFDDAKKRLDRPVAWLDLGAAILTARPLDARTFADRVADPSHREYVEAALLRWAGAPSGPGARATTAEG